MVYENEYDVKLNWTTFLSSPSPSPNFTRKGVLRRLYLIFYFHFLKNSSEPLKDHLRTVKIKGCFGAG